MPGAGPQGKGKVPPPPVKSTTLRPPIQPYFPLSPVQAVYRITLIVHRLAPAVEFYGRELGLRALPSPPEPDFPTAAFQLTDTQELHLLEWEDAYSYRGHLGLRVADFDGLLERAEALNIIDVGPYGKTRRLADGSRECFVRDPSGNLLALRSGVPTAADDLA